MLMAFSSYPPVRTVHLIDEPPDWQAVTITALPLTEALAPTEATAAPDAPDGVSHSPTGFASHPRS
jgi:hypothetical protein